MYGNKNIINIAAKNDIVSFELVKSVECFTMSFVTVILFEC